MMRFLEESFREKNPGPSPYIAAAEEIELSLFLIDTAKQAMEKLERR